MKSFLLSGFSAANLTNKSPLVKASRLPSFLPCFRMKASNLFAFLPTKSLSSTSKATLKFSLLHKNSHSGLQKNVFVFNPLAFMKTKLIILFFFISSAAFGQIDLYLTAGAGTGNYFNTIERDPNKAGFELKSILAGSIGAAINWEKFTRIKPYLGINLVFTGADHHSKFNSDIIPNYYIRYSYITIPIGLRIPVYKFLGVEATCVNNFKVADNTRNMVYRDAATWDIGLQPAIYLQHKRWRGGLSYYFGFKDALGIGYLDDADFRFYNRIFLFNLSYKVHSFK
ncbi:MAG: hypothetical protein FD155_29 [Bacteroidetes bacterium]|nr:MAG: hypothetical protein FD155_29 [Bacteroidota bacterium]